MKTKNLIFILLLSAGMSGYADPDTTAAVLSHMAQDASFEGERVAKEEAEEALKTADKTIVAEENIQKVREIIDKINAVGKVAYSLGQNGQDVLDTVNQVSDLVGGSVIFNKSVEEMTEIDLGTADEELQNFRRKSVEVLGKINNLGNDTMSRINGLWDTADAIYEAQQILGLKTINPEYQKLRELTKYSELASRQMEALISAVNGQNMMTQIEKSLDIVEDGINLRRQDEASKRMEEGINNLGKINLDNIDAIIGDSEELDSTFRNAAKYDFKKELNKSMQRGGIKIDESNW
ncbi:MAG: hypothetical protein SOZ27_06245 [Spirochaetia bacterium]|nr:hypothetical protein [Spirochaetia bacterium]